MRGKKYWIESSKGCPDCQAVRTDLFVREDSIGRKRILGWHCLACGAGEGERAKIQRKKSLQVKATLGWEWEEALDQARAWASADGMTLSGLIGRLLLRYLQSKAEGIPLTLPPSLETSHVQVRTMRTDKLAKGEADGEGDLEPDEGLFSEGFSSAPEWER